MTVNVRYRVPAGVQDFSGQLSFNPSKFEMNLILLDNLWQALVAAYFYL